MKPRGNESKLTRIQDTRDRFVKIVQSSNEAIITATPGLIVTSWNSAAERLFGYSESEAIGMNALQLVALEHAAEARAVGGRVARGERVGAFETICRRKDGSSVDISFSAFLLTDIAMEDELAYVARDLTEQRRNESLIRAGEEGLRALSGRLLTLREEERERIARDIHDILGQKLIAVRLDAAFIEKSVESSGNLQRPAATSTRADILERARSIGDTLDQVLSAIGNLAASLRPGMLDPVGFFPSIQWELRQFEHRMGIGVELQTTLDTIPLEEPVALAAYRILQEALINTARHGSARRVRVTLREDSSRVWMTIEDDGRGITDSEIASVRSLGLIGMRERARLAAASLIIGRGLEGGTVITLSLPKRRERSG